MSTRLTRGRLAALCAAVLALTIALGGFLIAGGSAPGHSDRLPPAPAAATAPPGTAPAGPSTVDHSVPSLTSADPENFARAVAGALFDWDTTTDRLEDSTGRLLAAADPTGQESPGLVADLAGYLPGPEAWDLLRSYETRQWLEIHTADIPAAWATARAQAPAGTLAPGTTAYTVAGTRHRAGVWDGEPVATAHPVAFTVFVVCAPTYEQCHLLRLSRLDEPLA